MTKLSFIIPCYHSEFTIENVVNEIVSTVKTRKEYSYEIILINDCSPDNVFDVIKKLAGKDKCIKGIALAKNFGQHSALMTGFNFATGKIIICLDDDGQTPANEMFNLIDKINCGYDIVFAKYNKKNHDFFRNIGSKINDAMAQYLLEKPEDLSLMSYFACRRFVIDEAKKYKHSYPYIAGLLLRITNKMTNVAVNHRAREVGTSGYTLKKLIALWLNGFTAFSIKPLRLATVTGVICSLIGFLYGWYIVIRKLIDPSVVLGYSSIMSVIVFVGGIIMLMLGMIGEYLGRIYISINSSPQFVIRETINIEEQERHDDG
jgi:undecaprenyl-phosphate 4-deoxy-4-formamido-L-arabinose transferase